MASSISMVFIEAQDGTLLNIQQISSITPPDKKDMCRVQMANGKKFDVSRGTLDRANINV